MYVDISNKMTFQFWYQFLLYSPFISIQSILLSKPLSTIQNTKRKNSLSSIWMFVRRFYYILLLSNEERLSKFFLLHFFPFWISCNHRKKQKNKIEWREKKNDKMMTIDRDELKSEGNYVIIIIIIIFRWLNESSEYGSEIWNKPNHSVEIIDLPSSIFMQLSHITMPSRSFIVHLLPVWLSFRTINKVWKLLLLRK